MSAPQPHPRPLAVGELDAGSLQRLLHLLNRRRGNVAALTLQFIDSRKTKPRRFG